MTGGELRVRGIVTSGVGGLYTVRDPQGREYRCRAKGAFRHSGLTPLVGDQTEISVPASAGESGAESDCRLESILPRKNALLRPAMANLDVLFFVIAAKEPEPSLRFIDKLLAILEYQHIEPVLVITKCDLDPEKAEKLQLKYEKCGFTVFLTDSVSRAGDGAVLSYLCGLSEGATAAFSGVSGAGKSTLMNRLFPVLSLETGTLSEKIARGRHTTRVVELFPLSELTAGTEAVCRGYLADTPGFSMLDFERFDFFPCEELPHVFREFVPYLGACRYTKCTHRKEDGCRILAAVAAKEIPKSRHTSYLELYEVLKNRKEWDKGK